MDLYNQAPLHPHPAPLHNCPEKPEKHQEQHLLRCSLPAGDSKFDTFYDQISYTVYNNISITFRQSLLI